MTPFHFCEPGEGCRDCDRAHRAMARRHVPMRETIRAHEILIADLERQLARARRLAGFDFDRLNDEEPLR
jgi:hypothetical protein